MEQVQEEMGQEECALEVVWLWNGRGQYVSPASALFGLGLPHKILMDTLYLCKNQALSGTEGESVSHSVMSTLCDPVNCREED